MVNAADGLMKNCPKSIAAQIIREKSARATYTAYLFRLTVRAPLSL
jgi:hypothetical protein